jgi:hypothetical protein
MGYDVCASEKGSATPFWTARRLERGLGTDLYGRGALGCLTPRRRDQADDRTG